MSGRLLMLIRHGDYKKWSNVEDQSGLTQCGIEQAKQAANALKRLPGIPPVVRIVSSTMARAMESAEIISFSFPETKVVFDETLNEGQLNSPSTRSRFDHVYDMYFTPVRGLEKVTDLIVCHANVIRYLTCRAIGMTDKCSLFMIPHCSITGIQVLHDSPPKIHFIASCTHLKDVDLGI